MGGSDRAMLQLRSSIDLRCSGEMEVVACVLRFLGWKDLMLGRCWLVIGRHLGEGKY